MISLLISIGTASVIGIALLYLYIADRWRHTACIVCDGCGSTEVISCTIKKSGNGKLDVVPLCDACRQTLCTRP